MQTDLVSGLSGALVGAILGLVGGGGSVLAVPLLVYGVGVPSAHVAIGTAAIAVAASALANLAGYWRAGQVKWRCGLVFAAAGVIGALIGARVAKGIDGGHLLALFGGLMIVVGILMFLRRRAEGDPSVRLTRASAPALLPWLLGTGFGVGLLSGFFGIGGGFLIVPALTVATGMALPYAIGTSLVAVTAFGTATASSYALSGLIDWRIALLFVAGGVLGGIAGTAMGRRLAQRRGALGAVLAVVITGVGIYVVGRSLAPQMLAWAG
jgi:uncharacterized membrane protein YfcA